MTVAVVSPTFGKITQAAAFGEAPQLVDVHVADRDRGASERLDAVAGVAPALQQRTRCG